MEQITGKNNSAKINRARVYYRYTAASQIVLPLMVLALAVISGYLCYQLDQLKQFNEEIKVNMKSSRGNDVLQRAERGITGYITGAHDGETTSVAFIHWGQRTCPSRTWTLLNEGEGTIAAFHDWSNNVVLGSDVFCVANNNSNNNNINSIDLEPPVTVGLKLQPVEFDLYNHSSYFRAPNKKGHLYCTHCFAEGTDVITQIGRSCKYPEWLLLYKGFLTTSYSYFGTSQSICVSSNAQPVSNHFFFSASRSMHPAMSGNVSPISRHANRRVSCYVCYRKPTAVSRFNLWE